MLAGVNFYKTRTYSKNCTLKKCFRTLTWQVYELLDEKLLAKSTIQPFNYVTLQCLAARALDKNKIPYKGFIPEELEAFIELH